MNLRTYLPILPLATAAACGDFEKKPAEVSDARLEVSEQVNSIQSLENAPNSVIFGKVTFRLSDQSQSLSPDQKKLLFANLESAYKILTDYFGEALMTVPEEMEVPLKVNLAKGTENAKVVWRNSADTRDRCNIVKIEPHELVVQTFSTDVLAHELFHLFQLHGYLESNMFVEGQAYALTALLFEKPSSWAANKERNDEMALPVHQGVLSKPWDFAFCQDVMPEDPSTRTMEMLIRTKHALLWLEFLKDNPNFLKDFYKKIAELRGKRERAYFTHKDLVEIAAAVSPKFMSWYEANPVLHPIQERTEGEKVLLWTPLGESRLGLFNFQVELSEGGGVKVSPITALNQSAAFTADLTIGEPFTGQFSASKLYQSVNIGNPFVLGPLVTDSRVTIEGELVQKVTQ